jgi:hypothetical protein
MAFNPWRALQAHEARVRQVVGNSARLATAVGFIDTNGWGEFQNEDVIEFGVTYIEEPAMSYGYAIDGDDLVDLRFPRAWGGVYAWDRDTRGFYTGAYVFLIVDTKSVEDIADVPTEIPSYHLNHYFTFSGIAMKTLPDDLLNLH